MSKALHEHLSRGTFNFLRPSAQELGQLVPSAVNLPMPQRIFLHEESATPILGFPMLLSAGAVRLHDALDEVLRVEEESQLAKLARRSFDAQAYTRAWDTYRQLLTQALENTILSSHGQNYPGVFWLHHSQHIATTLRALPSSIRRQSGSAGREHGDAIKYQIYFKYSDRINDLVHDVVQRLAKQLDQGENALFPPLLTAMLDNVLIFTEDYVGADLSELTSYFAGSLRIDGRALRQRLSALEAWHTRMLTDDAQLRTIVRDLLRLDPEGDPRAALITCGYVSQLSRHPAYDPSTLPSPEQVQVWEGLLVKLKEFELFSALRKMIMPLETKGDGLVARKRGLSTTWMAGPPVIKVSRTTRPIDVMAPWVVDPRVQRFGLVYDITNFSATLAHLSRAETRQIEDAFRQMYHFQRRINREALEHGLKLEKYLGDGAFYSSRYALTMLLVALQLQRGYREALTRRFPFDRGMRIALNEGEYRLLPLDAGGAGTSAGGSSPAAARYEFFGHGLVELSRLSTGKATQEIDAFRTYLIGQGYPEATVNKFFAPLQRRNAELITKIEESRQFYAYIDRNGALVNEGIVATEAVIRQIGKREPMFFASDGGRGYVVVPLEHGGVRIPIGVRKLGKARFKGLEPLPVYEIVDGADLDRRRFKPIAAQPILDALNRAFAAAMTARGKAQSS
ncbi:MAG: hypothetical protein AAF772_14720 [Acidobacteriota bacterium]